MNAKFTINLSMAEMAEILASHLDDQIFGMSVNSVNAESIRLEPTVDGFSVSGSFED